MGDKILVVDQHDLARSILFKILTRHGWKVRSAQTGKRALTLAKGNIFQLAIIDYTLPIMSGKELAETLSARYPRMKLLITTVYLEAPGSTLPLLLKPFRAEELISKLTELGLSP